VTIATLSVSEPIFFSPVRRDKPARCLRMKVPHGEGLAAHAGLDHARLSASSVVKR
jgi:hypothetical protein